MCEIHDAAHQLTKDSDVEYPEDRITLTWRSTKSVQKPWLLWRLAKLRTLKVAKTFIVIEVNEAAQIEAGHWSVSLFVFENERFITWASLDSRTRSHPDRTQQPPRHLDSHAFRHLTVHHFFENGQGQCARQQHLVEFT